MGNKVKFSGKTVICGPKAALSRTNELRSDKASVPERPNSRTMQDFVGKVKRDIYNTKSVTHPQSVFWPKHRSAHSSTEKSRLYRFPEIQTWCLILVQISLARADLQNDRPKQTVTGALMLPKRAAHAVHTTSDGAVHTRRDACSAAGCVRAAHEK